MRPGRRRRRERRGWPASGSLPLLVSASIPPDWSAAQAAVFAQKHYARFGALLAGSLGGEAGGLGLLLQVAGYGSHNCREGIGVLHGGVLALDSAADFDGLCVCHGTAAVLVALMQASYDRM